MDDDALKAELAALRTHVAAAQGEAIFAGVLIGPLLVLLVQSGAIDGDVAKRLIDVALLSLEKRRGATNETDQAAIDQARQRLEAQFRFLRGRSP